MSDRQNGGQELEALEPELRELERRLTAAFTGTRPRRGFEDELWSRLERRRDRRSLAWRPARWPALGAIAAVLVIGLAGVAVAPHLGAGGGAAPAASPRAQTGAGLAQPGRSTAAGAGSQRAPEPASSTFGPLPAPAPVPAAAGVRLPGGAVPYYGPARLTVTARPQAPAALPVYRYRQPGAADLDAFAASLGASRAGAAGTPTVYRSSDFRLDLLPAGNGQAPTFVISAVTAPAAPGPGTDERGAADAFIGSHPALQPSWPSTVSVSGQTVLYQRQFEVPGLPAAGQVDAAGVPTGLQVQVSGGAVSGARGPLPLTLETSQYSARSSDQAARDAASEPPAASAGPASTPAFVLDRVSLVYMAVSSGEYGYFVPVYLFSGNGKVGAGATASTKLVAVPALDASQLR